MRRTIRNLLFALFLIVFGFLGLALDRITLAWNPSPSPGVVGYILYYGPASHAYTNMVTVGNATNVTIGIQPLSDYFFAVTAYDSFGLESDFSEELKYAELQGAPIEWQLPTNVIVANYTWRLERSYDLKQWFWIVPPYYFDATNAFYRLKGIPK
jgi:hypothetical protein